MAYRLLCVDGGGMNGYSSIVILKRLLKEYPNLFNNIDLVAGTSVGGIVGLGIAMRHDIDSIEHNFLNGFPLAFKKNTLFKTMQFFAGLSPKYDVTEFKTFLREEVYGDTLMKDLDKKIVIPAFKLDDEFGVKRRWKAKVFHNFDGPTGDPDLNVVDVAMATSSVPVYFPTYDNYIDGALVANNPSLVAVAQTQDDNSNIHPKPRLEDIVILSIGSIRDIYIEGKNLQWGYFSWIKPLLQIFTERDTLIINHQCKVFFGDRYHRVEPVINGPMDSIEEISKIKDVGDSYPLDETVNWLKRYWQ